MGLNFKHACKIKKTAFLIYVDILTILIKIKLNSADTVIRIIKKFGIASHCDKNFRKNNYDDHKRIYFAMFRAKNTKIPLTTQIYQA